MRIQTVTHPTKPPKLFNQFSFPTRYVSDQFLKNARCACSPAVVDRLRHINTTRTQVQR